MVKSIDCKLPLGIANIPIIIDSVIADESKKILNISEGTVGSIVKIKGILA